MLKEILSEFSKIAGDPIENKEQIIELRKTDLTYEEDLAVKILEAKCMLKQKQNKAAEDSLLIVLDQLKDINIPVLDAFVYKYLQHTSYNFGRYTECLSYSLKYMEIIEETEPSLFPERFQELAFAYMCKRKYEQAEEFFVKSIKIFEELDDESQKVSSLYGMGELYLRQGLYVEAQENLLKAISYFKSENKSEMLNKSLLNYGLVLINMGNIDAAISIFKELSELLENSNNDRLKGFAYFNLGLCYQKKEDYISAEEAYKKSYKILEPFNNLLTNKKIYNNLALIYEKLKKNDLVMKYYQKAYDVSCELNDEFNKRITRSNIISHKLVNNQFFPEMRKEIEDNINYFIKEANEERQITAKKILSFYYFLKKDYQKAFEILNTIFEQQGEFYQKQLSEQNQDFYEMIQDTILRRERVKNILEPELQKSIKHNLIGISAALRKAVEMAKKASSIKNTNVLITGESGTGKEIVSRLIHFNSERKSERLVTVNCSAITASLAESEFFGHIQGAFTGAINNKVGLFEQANRGTLYLDEIGDMTIEIQSKILRAIETGTIPPVGGEKEINVDVRIVASTNKDLDDLILQNKFRLDLLHRINVIHIKIPPLRDRDDDLILLIEHFVKQISNSLNRKDINFEDSYVNALRGYSFPGNIRELKNIIERSIILATSNTLTSESLHDINCERKDTSHSTGSLRLSDVEKDAVFNALSICNNSQKEAAKLLGLSESALSRKLKRYR